MNISLFGLQKKFKLMVILHDYRAYRNRRPPINVSVKGG